MNARSGVARCIAGLALAVLACGAAGSACAATADDSSGAVEVQAAGMQPASLQDFPAVALALQRNQPATALALLQEAASEHENDPSFFNLLGVVALKVPDYATAASAFERVVIIQPDNGGAWIDLAIASAELGNRVSALGYFDHIEARFDPPEALRAVMTRYRSWLSAAAPASTGWQVQVQSGIGSNSNANSGLQNSIIPLDFDNQQVDFVLDPSYRARRDAMIDALGEHMPEGVTWTVPEGGFFIWLTTPDRVDTRAMFPKAIKAGIDYLPGTACRFDGHGTHEIRLSFSVMPEARIREGIARLGRLIYGEITEK